MESGGLSIGEWLVIVLIPVFFLSPFFGVAYFRRWQAGRIGERQPAAGSSPEEILRDRFAKGEISEEELREMLQALRDSRAP